MLLSNKTENFNYNRRLDNAALCSIPNGLGQETKEYIFTMQQNQTQIQLMKKELYFDISSEKSGGSLYRITDNNGNISFLYQHSVSDEDRDEISVFETPYSTFADFWKMLIQDWEWFYQHPLYIHPEQRDFIKEQLQQVNWAVHPNKKWQESHQRQWKKTLEAASDYYRSG